MDPQTSLQDVLRCHLCETPMPNMFCDICQLNICEPCVGTHLCDKSKEHRVVPFKKRLRRPRCEEHSFQQCQLHCEQCIIYLCVQCVSSGEHKQHKKVDVLINFENMKDALQTKLQELEKAIYPKYQEIASVVTEQKADLDKNCKKLRKRLNKQEKDWHREIDNVVKILKANADRYESNAQSVLDKQEIEIQNCIAEIKQSIVDIRKLLETNDVNAVSVYKSRNDEFRRLPDKALIPLPYTYRYKIEQEPIFANFRSLSPLFTRTRGGFSMDSPCVKPTLMNKQIMKEPKIVSYIATRSAPCMVSCLNEEEIWTTGTLPNDTMTLYNLDGDIVKSIRTTSGYTPTDITVTKSGDLVYTDSWDGTVNLVRNSHIEAVIRLEGWSPHGVCCTSSDDLLTVMVSEDIKQTKVVRYSGFTEKQSIQFDDKGQPLYTKYFCGFYIAENINQDICVANGGTVVVVNKAGKLRFRYTASPSTTSEQRQEFSCITTDSLGRILIADCTSHCIHIIDQDGQFLRYIDNCELDCPNGLCIGSEDNLFVADKRYARDHEVKEIQYYMHKYVK